ncbi:MAG: acyl carrier protein [Desulfuromonadaceae bacterium]|nr:acyl carrier protein [Desulfuromonadaceae bacterium]
MTLEKELKELIIDACNVPDAPEEFSDTAPLIGPDSPLGLDSLDAVELVVAVQKRFGVRIGGEDTSREVLESIETLAAFIRTENS